MRGVQRRVLRSREQSLILLAIALIAPLMAIQRLFSGNPSVDLSLGARIAFMLLTVVLAAFRVSRSGVVVTEEGVVVKNPLRSQSFRWEEIVCFSLRRRGLFPGLGHVDLQDGRVVPIYGIAAPNALAAWLVNMGAGSVGPRSFIPRCAALWANPSVVSKGRSSRGGWHFSTGCASPHWPSG
jgi:hypothetical protein